MTEITLMSITEPIYTTDEVELPEQEPEPDEDREFLVGATSSTRFGCGTKVCPAMAAGYEPGLAGRIEQVAVEYDHVLWDWVGDMKARPLTKYSESEFLVDEETAKRAWFQAIRNLRERHGWSSKTAAISSAHDVAYRLGWLDEGEEVSR